MSHDGVWFPPSSTGVVSGSHRGIGYTTFSSPSFTILALSHLYYSSLILLFFVVVETLGVCPPGGCGWAWRGRRVISTREICSYLADCSGVGPWSGSSACLARSVVVVVELCSEILPELA